MARRRRLHVAGATYFAVQLGGSHCPLFSEPSDYQVFEALLSSALSKADAHVLAFCWLPHAIHMSVQVAATPLGRFLQGFTSHYARYVHARTGESGHLFADRYRALLIDPDEWLLRLIRYIHYLPVLKMRVDLDAYPQTSHPAYCGTVSAPWLDRRMALRLLRTQGDAALAYTTLMSQRPSEEETRLFTHGTRSGVLGSDAFIAKLPRGAHGHRSSLDLEQIIGQVATLLSVDYSELFSKSRRREIALARALIAWHATERSIANLIEVGRRLRRDPSTLSVGIARYRVLHPDLFTLAALRHLKPIA